MPEGDTVFRAARALARALEGQVVTGFDARSPVPGHTGGPIPGRTVTRVWAIGKHLLIAFSGDLVLRTHLRMHGAWHVYRATERWRRPRAAMRLAIATHDLVAVAFNMPVAEFLRAGAVRSHPVLAALGPDLLAPDFDEAEATRRLRSSGCPDLAEALLDQHVMAGIGNEFKSEILFAQRLDPFRSPSTLTEEEALGLVRTARRMLGENVREGRMHSPGRRTTRLANPALRLAVYSRAGRPCLRCAAPIRRVVRGEHARVTYWCPRCQG